MSVFVNFCCRLDSNTLLACCSPCKDNTTAEKALWVASKLLFRVLNINSTLFSAFDKFCCKPDINRLLLNWSPCKDDTTAAEAFWSNLTLSILSFRVDGTLTIFDWFLSHSSSRVLRLYNVVASPVVILDTLPYLHVLFKDSNSKVKALWFFFRSSFSFSIWSSRTFIMLFSFIIVISCFWTLESLCHISLEIVDSAGRVGTWLLLSNADAVNKTQATNTINVLKWFIMETHFSVSAHCKLLTLILNVMQFYIKFGLFSTLAVLHICVVKFFARIYTQYQEHANGYLSIALVLCERRYHIYQSLNLGASLVIVVCMWNYNISRVPRHLLNRIHFVPIIFSW